MKAIVLSCDRYHPITEHMIMAYDKLWKSNPFVFRIPWNDEYPTFLEERFGDKVEFKKTPIEFKETIYELISDLDEDEWIYWCTDDSYPITLDEEKANKTYEWVKTVDDSVLGVMFFYGEQDRNNNIANKVDDVVEYDGIKFFRKRWITYQWQHQFFRVKVLRQMFDSLDEPNEDLDYIPEKYSKYLAKQLDVIMSRKKANSFWNLIHDGKWYVISKNIETFGESTSRGYMLSNCEDSFKEYGLSIPPDFEVSPRIIIKT